MRQQTWFAIIVCVLGILPGLIIGALASYVYRSMTGHEIGYNPDFLMLRTFFGIETPGLIIQWIYLTAIPIAVHGGVAGAFALFATSWICKGARYDLAASTTGALYTGIVLVMLVMTLALIGVTKDGIESVIQLIGLWIGLISALASVHEAPPRSQAT